MLFTPITPEELAHPQYARRRDLLAMQGIRLAAEDLPRLNEVAAADPRTTALDDSDDTMARLARKSIVMDAMSAVGAELQAAGIVRAPEEMRSVGLASPEPTIWPNGIALQRTAEVVLRTLDAEASIVDFGAWAEGGPNPREVTGLGWLYTEQELADLLSISVATLRSWRVKRTHFEFVKFPGQRGPVFYTERGIRAFFAHHTQGLAAL